MAVRIRLLRMGKIRNPQYRIVIADSRVKRDGKAIEFVGIYHPKEEPSLIEVKSDRVQHWLAVGAQPSEAVVAILSKTGDWQKYKGLPAPTQPLKVAAPRADRTAAYEAASQAAAGLEPAKAAPAKKAKAEPRTEAKAEAKAEPKTEAKAEAKTEAKAKAEIKTEAPAEPVAAVEETAVAAADDQQG